MNKHLICFLSLAFFPWPAAAQCITPPAKPWHWDTSVSMNIYADPSVRMNIPFGGTRNGAGQQVNNAVLAWVIDPAMQSVDIRQSMIGDGSIPTVTIVAIDFANPPAGTPADAIQQINKIASTSDPVTQQPKSQYGVPAFGIWTPNDKGLMSKGAIYINSNLASQFNTVGGTATPILSGGLPGFTGIFQKIAEHEIEHGFGVADVVDNSRGQTLMDQIYGTNDYGAGIPDHITTCDEDRVRQNEGPPCTDVCNVNCPKIYNPNNPACSPPPPPDPPPPGGGRCDDPPMCSDGPAYDCFGNCPIGECLLSLRRGCNPGFSEVCVWGAWSCKCVDPDQCNPDPCEGCPSGPIKVISPKAPIVPLVKPQRMNGNAPWIR